MLSKGQMRTDQNTQVVSAMPVNAADESGYGTEGTHDQAQNALLSSLTNNLLGLR